MRKYLLILMTFYVSILLISNALATISPTTLTATLGPGESITETKTVFLPGVIPKGDVIFALDLTGSMGDDIDVAKAEAINIMNALDLLISDAKYGVMSFMDYPDYYDSYGYASLYGDAAYGDYAYSLDLPLTNDKTQVSDTINALVLGYGGDGPQDYTRIMYESYADGAIGWRTGARHIVVIFGDAVPHDDDLNAGVPGKVGTLSTGGDPGRNEVMDFGGDDLDLQTVLSEMDTNNMVLLYVSCESPYPSDALDYWEYWTSLTGGDAYQIADADEIPAAIQALVAALATHIDTLTLKAEAGYESWLTSVVPPEYTDIDIPPAGVTETFDIIITVPLGTTPGIYYFNITADADGASYGEQSVEITVFQPPVGGYSISFAKQAPTYLLTAYTTLVVVFAGTLAYIKRKRK